MKTLYNTFQQAEFVAHKSDLIRYDEQTGKYYIEVDGMRYHSQEKQNIESDKGFSSRNPLKFREEDNRKELSDETNSHEGCSLSPDKPIKLSDNHPSLENIPEIEYLEEE
ncbi:MAG: hypothetical protein ACOCV1_00220 [Bacillota bacterium]